MARFGPVPKAGSHDTRYGRNTYHRQSPSLPPVKPSDVKPPASVKADKAALAFWKHHAPTLVANKFLRPEQAEVFAVVCRYHSEITALMARVEAEGPIVVTKQGPIISPAARLLQQTRKDFSKLASAFGMTPESESRIPRPADHKPDEANPLAQFGITG